MNGVFKDDLAVGKAGEAEAKAILASNGWMIDDLSDEWCWRAKDIDFRVRRNDETHTLEVKNSVRTAETGNVFVEIYHPINHKHNSDGWLYYSEAELFGFLSDGCLHIVSSSELRDYIKAHPSLRQVTVYTDNSRGLLIPLREIEQFETYVKLRREQ